MKPTDIIMGRVYAVWISRKLQPVFIQGRNPSGSYYGRVYPGGRNVRVKNAASISEQIATGPHLCGGVNTLAIDYKSKAAGERDE